MKKESYQCINLHEWSCVFLKNINTKEGPGTWVAALNRNTQNKIHELWICHEHLTTGILTKLRFLLGK